MTHRFKAGNVYCGECIYGGCGSIERNHIRILKRTIGKIVYQEEYTGRIVTNKRLYMSGWGDCLETSFEYFHAFDLDNEHEM